MSNEPSRHARQALQVFKHDEQNAELHVTSSDEAASLLWAAQWLDEHREYSATAIELRSPADGQEDEWGSTTLVVTMHLFNEHEPARFGPWPHAVPPMPL